MKSFMLFAMALAAAVPATASPITWGAADRITHVYDPENGLPGLTAGTPWSLEITFNPDVPRMPSAGASSVAWACYVYDVGATATLQLGEFTYTQSGGQVYTNSMLPDATCRSAAPSWSPPGLIQFAWLGNWTQEPGAWNLNDVPMIFLAGYYDAVHQDGSLPTSPTIGPTGNFSGLHYEGNGNRQEFTSRFEPRLIEQPTAVPEPATLTMLGAGLALLARRRLRKSSR